MTCVVTDLTNLCQELPRHFPFGGLQIDVADKIVKNLDEFAENKIETGTSATLTTHTNYILSEIFFSQFDTISSKLLDTQPCTFSSTTSYITWMTLLSSLFQLTLSASFPFFT